MNLLIIGATGGTGQELVKQALEQGHRVTAFVRNPDKFKIKHSRLSVEKGDVLDYASVDKVVRDQHIVLCALGHKKWFVKTTILSEGTKNLINAMEKYGVKRFICETTLGIGNTRGKMGLYYSLFVIPVIIYSYFRDKERQERYIRESDLNWVIVRPGQLTNGKRTGKYRHGKNIGNRITTVSISRADVADFMLNQITDNIYLKKTPAIAY